MKRVAKLLRAAATRFDPGVARAPRAPWGLDDEAALERALAQAERDGVASLGPSAVTVEQRPAWRARYAAGGGITAWRIAGHIGFFRYFPAQHDDRVAGLEGSRTAEEVWRAMLAADEGAPWCFVHDIRAIRGISRDGRGAGLAAYRAIAPRLHGSAIVTTPAQEPIARAFQLLLQGDVLRGCSIHRRAVDAVGPCLVVEAPAVDESGWIDALFGATELDLGDARHTVLAPAEWRLRSGDLQLRLALLDGRVVVARFDGEARADDIAEVAARYDLVRAVVSREGALHVCDTRGVSGFSLAAVRATMREFTPARMAWLGASRNLVRPQLGPLLRLLDPLFPKTLDSVVASGTLRGALTSVFDHHAAGSSAPSSAASPHRAAIDRAIGVLAQLATHADIDVAPPVEADAPVRDLFHALALVRDDVRGLTASLRAANAGLEARIDARTADLARAKGEAEALAAEKLRLLSTMSHEVRTPLHGIATNVALLEHTALDAEQSSLVRSLATSTEHLRALVDDLLDWAQMDGELHELHTAACDLGGLARGVVDALRGGAEARGVPLRLELDAALPAAVQGNAVRLRQVLFNLVGNAVKFTVRGEVTVRVDAPDAATLRVEVRDTGVGIAAEHLARVFEPFSPAARASAARFGGTGLGLAITRRIVTLHGGDITVESDPATGTVVTVTLPLRAVAGPHAAPTPQPPAELGGLRVLLAEDNPTMQFVTARLLRRWRVTHAVVDDGAACLDALRDAPYDVVLMDLQMPVLDGFDATARIRAHDAPAIRGVRVIALTADASPEARARALGVGADAVLTKPYRPEELFTALSHATPGPRGEPQSAAAPLREGADGGIVSPVRGDTLPREHLDAG